MLTAKSARRRRRKFLHWEATKKNAGREARSAERPAFFYKEKFWGVSQTPTGVPNIHIWGVRLTPPDYLRILAIC